MEKDGQQYPKDSLLINYGENDYIAQDRELLLFFKENIGEPIIKFLISYPDMKTNYPIEVIDLRHQDDQITPKKIQLFQEYGADSINARFFLITIRRREIEFIIWWKQINRS